MQPMQQMNMMNMGMPNNMTNVKVSKTSGKITFLKGSRQSKV